MEWVEVEWPLPHSPPPSSPPHSLVWRRCAMLMIVDERDAARMARRTAASDAGSRLAVASSSRTTGGRRTSTRAKQSSCRWPAVSRSAPPSPTGVCMPCGSAPTTAVRLHSSMARSSTSGGSSPAGSRFCAIVRPLMRTGSCGTHPTMERSCARGSVAVSTSSMKMRPAVERRAAAPRRGGSTSIRRSSARPKVDLPAQGGRVACLPCPPSIRPSPLLPRTRAGAADDSESAAALE